jgi:hypothetical protein
MQFMTANVLSGVDSMSLFKWLFHKRKNDKAIEAEKIHSENIKKIQKAGENLKMVEESRVHLLRNDSVTERIYRSMGGARKP